MKEMKQQNSFLTKCFLSLSNKCKKKTLFITEGGTLWKGNSYKSHAVHTDGTWELKEGATENFPFGNTFEGKIINDDTFIGMMKLDQNRYLAHDGALHLTFTEFSYDTENTTANTTDPDIRIEGNWQLTIPFTVDETQCRTIEVNKKSDDGYCIREVFISPYQIIVFSDVPYTTLSPDTYTREDFEQQWGQKNKEIIANGEQAVTYEDALSQKHYQNYDMEIYNQNGEPLGREYGDHEKSVFAVQKHELSKLHIYIGDAAHELAGSGISNEEEAKKHCILDAEIDLNR